MRCASNHCKKKMKKWAVEKSKRQAAARETLIVGAAATQPPPQPVDAASHRRYLIWATTLPTAPAPGVGDDVSVSGSPTGGANGVCRWGTLRRQEEAAGVDLG